MFLSFLFISIVVLGEYYNKSKLTKDYKLKEFIVFIQYGFMSFSYIGYTLLYKEEVKYDFLIDYRFWLLILLESVSLLLALKNFKKNSHQVHVIGYFQFLTLSIIPIIVLGLDSINVFDNVIKMPFKSNIEWMIFIVGNTIFVLLFSIPKILNHKINGIFLLLLQSLSLSLTLIFAIRLIQEYKDSSVLLYGFVFLFLSLFYLIIGVKNLKNVNILDNIDTVLKTSLVCIGIYFTVWVFNLMAAKMIAIEMFAIFKRLAQVLNAYIFDMLSNKSIGFINKNDLIIVLGIFLFNITLLSLI